MKNGWLYHIHSKNQFFFVKKSRKILYLKN